ncbi:MAG: serine/threonine protein kinase, partial [Myxococcaceae bacterium]|nr:serine/threonine protein kinase [Myxococcaceae bacterium]
MASGALVEGTRVGPYALTRQLAVGGMASVWEAQHRDGGQRVALKVLHWQYASDDRIVGRFLDEARLGVVLQHPNIVRTLDVGRDGPSLVYLALDLLDGASLNEVVQANPHGLPYPAVVALGAQAADALAYAHAFRRDDGALLNLVHRDVKPSNLLLTVQGVLKVIDFGIARVQWETKGQTQTGSFVGSLAYSAPEQVNELAVTAASDVFSLGAVLHELLTGAQVFGRASQAATVRAVSWSPAPPVRSVRPDVPRALEACVLRALEKKPEARFESAAALAQALRESLGGEAPWGPEQLAALARVPRRPLVAASGTQSLP